MNFFNTSHCMGGAHCRVCRDKVAGANFRSAMHKACADITTDLFECPRGKPWVTRSASGRVISGNACDAGNYCRVCRERVLGIPFRETASSFLSNVSGTDFECPKHKPWTVAGALVPDKPTDEQRLYFAFATQLQDIMLKAKMGSCGCNKSVLAQRINAKLEYYRNAYYSNGGCDETKAKKV